MKCYIGDSVRLQNPYSIERKKRQQQANKQRDNQHAYVTKND